ncbi:hypothetical protein [Blastococcus sp. SYSU DS1024]
MPSGLRTSRTGRVPQWVLDEASGRAPTPEPWRTWSPRPSFMRPARPGAAAVVWHTWSPSWRAWVSSAPWCSTPEVSEG